MSDYKLVPIGPTPEMVEAAEDAYMPFGDMDLAIRMAMLAAPAVQGEPVAWSGWGCQYPGKMPRLYGERRIAELNCDWENGDQLLSFTAAPQPAEQRQNTLIGRTVSMDVSTGDHDACHRLFGTVIGVEGRDGVILCELQEDNHDVEDVEQQPDATQLVEALEAVVFYHEEVEDNDGNLMMHYSKMMRKVREALAARRKQEPGHD